MNETLQRDEQTATAIHSLTQKRLHSQGDPEVPNIGDCLRDLFGTRPGIDTTDSAASLSLIHRANIPKRHQIKLLRDTGTEAKAWSKSRDRVVGQLGGGFLIALIGPRGTGKTQIAQQAVVRAAGVGRESLYMKAMDVFLWLRAAIGPDAERTQLAAVAELIRPPLLIIDEIQERGETPFEDRMLTYIIDHRYDAMVDTLLIGNLTDQSLAESLGASIVDRLTETGGIIRCNWGSFRTTPEPER